MRIIGGHDYYDGAMAYGRDEAIVFVRHGREVDRKLVPIAAPAPHFRLRMRKSRRWNSLPIERTGPNNCFRYVPNNHETWDVQALSVVFCGRLYRAIRIIETFDGRETRRHFWRQSEFTEWLDEHGVVTDFDWGKRGVPLSYLVGPQPPLDKVATEWVSANSIVTAIALPAPGETAWHMNSSGLKDIEFYRVFDPWSAWQEISMFVGGVLPAQGREMVTISDKVRLEKHGFDRVRSFRNMGRSA